MLVGEQPGDQEDLQGHPFVGPAGRRLALDRHSAGIHRRPHPVELGRGRPARLDGRAVRRTPVALGPAAGWAARCGDRAWQCGPRPQVLITLTRCCREDREEAFALFVKDLGKARKLFKAQPA